ncbi:hypothetical protein DLM77_14355 [Leptospira yasudae]|uniref:Uncharacterized protein n=1 Tax=Leptospira yasudae TaxID=2202201 RepID=A0ABX9M317_9LEPT|nr:hypothetical protein DLM77_14355 [Leptospira yasudae]
MRELTRPEARQNEAVFDSRQFTQKAVKNRTLQSTISFKKPFQKRSLSKITDSSGKKPVRKKQIQAKPKPNVFRFRPNSEAAPGRSADPQ